MLDLYKYLHVIVAKTLEYDLLENKRFVVNVVRMLLESDYLTYANEFTTKIYKEYIKERFL